MSRPELSACRRLFELDSGGQILRSLHGPGGARVSVITSFHEDTDGRIYLGTLLHDYIARLDPGKLEPGSSARP